MMALSNLVPTYSSDTDQTDVFLIEHNEEMGLMLEATEATATELNEVLTFVELEPVAVQPIEATFDPDIASTPGFVEIIFHGNGDINGAPPERIVVQTPHSFTANMSYHHMSIDGYEFSGWLHPESVQAIRPGQTAIITGTGVVNLYALWESVFIGLHNDMNGAGVQPLSTFQQFAITNPASNGVEVPRQNLTVTWVAVPGTMYVITFRNETTGNIYFDRRDRGNATSYVIQQNMLTAGHQHSVSVRSMYTSTEYTWAHRTFRVAGGGGAQPTPTPGPTPTPTSGPTPTPTPNPNLTLNPHMTTWSPSAESNTTDFITVTTNGPGWAAISSNPSWLWVSRNTGSSGDRLTISVSANSRTDSRPGTVTIRTNVAEHVIAVVQEGNTVIIMEYELLVNSEGNWSARLNEASDIMDNVRVGFRDVFGVDLVRRNIGVLDELNQLRDTACLFPDICTAVCGEVKEGVLSPEWPFFTPVHPNGSDCATHPHHKSGGFLIREGGSNTLNTFRFVGFPVCFFSASQNRHFGVHGLASGNNISGNTIVSVAHDWMRHDIATAHEISHLLGATDATEEIPCTSPCVMYGGWGRDHDDWCDRCYNMIRSRLH